MRLRRCPSCTRAPAHLFFCLVLWSWISSASAQQATDAATQRHEYQQWFSLGLGYDPTRRLSLDAQYVLRNYGMVERFKGSYYYLQARYRINKHFYPDAQVRVVNTFTDDLFRIEVGMQYRYRKRKNLFSYRLGYFNERKHLLPDDQLQEDANNYIRNKVRYRRDLPKHLLAYASVETYTKFDAEGWRLKRMAYIVGVIRRLNGPREVFLEYLYQPEYNEVAPVHLSSLTLGFTWDLTKLRYHSKGKGSRERDDR